MICFREKFLVFLQNSTVRSNWSLWYGIHLVIEKFLLIPFSELEIRDFLIHHFNINDIYIFLRIDNNTSLVYYSHDKEYKRYIYVYQCWVWQDSPHSTTFTPQQHWVTFLWAERDISILALESDPLKHMMC